MDAASEPEGLDASDEAAAMGPEPGRSLDARLVRRLLAALGNPPIEFQLAWTGERIAGSGGAPVARLRIADRPTLLSVVSDPRVRFGDAYSAGKVEIEGDLVELLNIIYRSASAGTHGG